MSKKTTSTPIIDESAGLKDQLARALADYANQKKRFERDSASIVKFANSSLLAQLVEFRDHLELSAKTLSDQGLSMLIKQLDKILQDEGVKEIDTGRGFDPQFMECSEMVEGDKDQIIAITRKGYLLHDRVLRPASVQLGAGHNSDQESVDSKQEVK